MIDDCEVTDWVVDANGNTVQYRRQNYAANVELQRRYPGVNADRWGGLSLSGETAPYGIEWRNTCGGSVIEQGGPNPMAYGIANYGETRYGGMERLTP
jgi:hypothetical protein